MIVMLLTTEHPLEFLTLKGGCRGSSQSTHVKMSHCWKSHATAHIALDINQYWDQTRLSITHLLLPSLEGDVKSRGQSPGFLKISRRDLVQ